MTTLSCVNLVTIAQAVSKLHRGGFLESPSPPPPPRFQTVKKSPVWIWLMYAKVSVHKTVSLREVTMSHDGPAPEPREPQCFSNVGAEFRSSARGAKFVDDYGSKHFYDLGHPFSNPVLFRNVSE